MSIYPIGLCIGPLDAVYGAHIRDVYQSGDTGVVSGAKVAEGSTRF